MDIKVIVAAHKAYQMPDDDIYLPLQVGAEGKESIGYKGDNTGDNISYKNDRYCELTGLYFAWKNLEYDALGLVHYRRHFSDKNRVYKRSHTPFECVLSSDEAKKYLTYADIIVPKKRKYYIETLYSHYDHTLDANHLELAEKVVAEKYPSYIEAVREVYDRRWGYMFNMFIMKKEYVDEYCNWLFTILEEMERRLDISDMSAFEKRLFGRVSEILFNAWLLEKIDQGAKVVEVPFISTEKVNWWKKGTAFLKAKFFGKKYEESF